MTRSRPALLEDLPVFDAHADTIGGVVDQARDLKSDPDSHIDLDRLVLGGVGSQVFACWPEPTLQPENRAAHRVFALIDAFHEQAAIHRDRMGLACSVAESEAIRADGRVAGFLGIEGGHAIEQDLALLRIFHRLGVRTMTITWSNHTGWADGCGDRHFAPAAGGLSRFGRRVIDVMQDLGMVVDVSHAAPVTLDAVADVASRPFIASHSNARALCEHPRNLTDRQATRVAESGGVVCVTLVNDFIVDHRDTWQALTETEEYRSLPDGEVGYTDWLTRPQREFHDQRVPRPTLADVVRHIRHLVGVIGDDHVGVGSDFDGCPRVPLGMEDTSHYADLAQALLDQGLSEQQVRKILGDNLRRVYRTCLGS